MFTHTFRYDARVTSKKGVIGFGHPSKLCDESRSLRTGIAAFLFVPPFMAARWEARKGLPVRASGVRSSNPSSHRPHLDVGAVVFANHTAWRPLMAHSSGAAAPTTHMAAQHTSRCGQVSMGRTSRPCSGSAVTRGARAAIASHPRRSVSDSSSQGVTRSHPTNTRGTPRRASRCQLRTGRAEMIRRSGEERANAPRAGDPAHLAAEAVQAACGCAFTHGPPPGS